MQGAILSIPSLSLKWTNESERAGERASRASAAYKEHSLTQTNLLQFPQAKKTEASLMIMHCFHIDTDSPWRVVESEDEKGKKKGKQNALCVHDGCKMKNASQL